MSGRSSRGLLMPPSNVQINMYEGSVGHISEEWGLVRLKFSGGFRLLLRLRSGRHGRQLYNSVKHINSLTENRPIPQYNLPQTKLYLF
jgi:hypothetical protein